MKNIFIKITLILGISYSASGLNVIDLQVQNKSEISVKDIIISTDSGVEIDDQWMILHMVKQPAINVKAIFSSHCGNCSFLEYPQSESSYKNIRNLLELINMESVPVFEGSNTALINKESVYDPTADAIFNIAEHYSEDNRLTVVVSGPATDIAGAINKYPVLENKIEILATGFVSAESGGLGFNVGNDLTAWQILLEKNIPVTISTGATAKEYFLMDKEDVSALFQEESHISRYLQNEFNSWLNSNRDFVLKNTGNENSWPIWDEILAAYLLGYCKTETRERPVLLGNGYFNYYNETDLMPVNWIISSDSDSTWDNFAEVMD